MWYINWLGVSRCRLIKVDGLDLHLEELDAVDGTPVLDIKALVLRVRPARGDQATDQDDADAWAVLRGAPPRRGRIHRTMSPL
ncbi:TrmO family methyltransferase [Micromonospora sp. 4G55]|uniref:TrmO family methyltransferase domain-containing protein n=1 Tax=Micromonospora sp. 4G55 TaxID=2806102 RepID=UPI00281211A5|nr:TrmO family methyltransferase [Micromonospora sp. 4G55]